MQEEEIKIAIFRKLFVMKKIGASHTPFENIQKGFPKHLRGEVNRKIISELVKERWLLMKKHNYGVGVSLNPERINEVRNILRKHFPEFA